MPCLRTVLCPPGLRIECPGHAQETLPPPAKVRPAYGPKRTITKKSNMSVPLLLDLQWGCISINPPYDGNTESRKWIKPADLQPSRRSPATLPRAQTRASSGRNPTSPAASGTASPSSPEAGATHGHFVDMMECEITASKNAGDACPAAWPQLAPPPASRGGRPTDHCPGKDSAPASEVRFSRMLHHFDAIIPEKS